VAMRKAGPGSSAPLHRWRAGGRSVLSKIRLALAGGNRAPTSDPAGDDRGGDGPGTRGGDPRDLDK
jgi:hypothetical protein